MLRIYETADAQLVDKIVLTTNNQNKISSRDLRSNDKVQVDMQEAFLRYNLYYERKVNQFGTGIPIDRIVVNEIVAQSYLGIALKKPSDARRRKYKVWGELYDKIFSGQAVEPYVIATLLHREVSKWVSETGLTGNNDDLRRKVANNGIFHIARIAAYLWRGSDNWNNSAEELRNEIKIVEMQSNSLAPIFESAFTKLAAIVGENAHYKADLDLALKSATLDIDIDKALHA
jgi:hypothetical protein